MLSAQELEASPLFRNITYEEYQRMLTCFQAVQRSYLAEELVYDFSAGRTDAIGVVAFAGSAGDSLEVVARKPCDILFIDYPHLFHRCEKACTHHSILVQNMLELLSQKAQALSERVDVLSRRSIREKLLCYFRQLAEKSGGTFTLPFSFSVLADYIATDRSAMMRELRHLKEQGVLRTDGRKITLLQRGSA